MANQGGEMPAMLTVEVAYALPERQWLEVLTVPAGSHVLDALRQSALWQQFPGLPAAEALTVGVWSKVEKAPAERLLCDGDRIEVYRPLLNDPKDARKARAERVKAGKAGR